MSNYIDGDVDAGLRHDLEMHLQGCHHCTVVLNQVKKTVDLFCDAEPVDLPSEVRARLYEALQRKLGANL
jgi:anti-sigma factor RsiW